MADPTTPAHLYFRPPTGGFWRWAERGRVLAWPDGTTIAFREEIAAVLDRLAPLGLPPFGSVALLLAACHESYQPLSLRDERLGKLAQELIPFESKALIATGRAVFGALDRVRALPKPIRSTLAGKITLAEVVAERSPRRKSVEHSKIIASCFKRGLGPETLAHDDGDEWTLQGLLDDLNSLKPGLEDVSADALATRMKTGVDAVVEPAELEVPFAERLRKLVAELLQDDEHAGLARAVQRLLAAVSLPRPLASPDELSLGGISDVSNRGSLDRLLVSELVHDDLTLAVRVAMNEALYLRREAPPQRPPSRRALLLDVGVRMWGLPRLFGAAAAIALGVQAGDDDVQAYRAAGPKVDKVDLASREGLVAHLAALETAPHPGAALPAFLEAAALEGGRLDAVVVTHPDAFADRAFLQALDACGAASIYVATVARDGDFRLWEWAGGNRRPLTQARLPLDKLFGEKRGDAARKLVDKSLDPKLPLAVRAVPCPLLTARHLLGGVCCRLSENRTAIATRDGRILIWSDPQRGAWQVAAVDRPIRKLFALGPRKLLAVVGCLNPRKLQSRIYDLNDSTATTAELRFEGLDFRPESFHVQGGLLYASAHGWIQVVDPTDGSHLQSLVVPPGVLRCGDRYYMAIRSRLNEPVPLSALVHDGREARFEVVAPECPFRLPVRIFDVEGTDGPWASNGLKMVNVSSLAREGGALKALPLPPTSYIKALAQDGRRMVYVANSRTYSRDLRGGRFVPDEPLIQAKEDEKAAVLHMPPELWVETNHDRVASRVQRRKFHEIGTLGSELVLFGRTSWRLTPPALNELRNTPVNHGSIRMKRPFVAVHRLPRVRYHLRVAEWNDGSRAYLDSRGLLHLVGSDPQLPEIAATITHDAPPAVWASDGRRWGDPYFHPSDATIERDDAWCDLVRRFVERLR